MPKPFPPAFRRDVIAVFRSTEGAAISHFAKDFGIPESCLKRWLKLDDVEASRQPGTTAAEVAESREAKKRIRLLV